MYLEASSMITWCRSNDFKMFAMTASTVSKLAAFRLLDYLLPEDEVTVSCGYVLSRFYKN
jgi:hypothetical protein